VQQQQQLATGQFFNAPRAAVQQGQPAWAAPPLMFPMAEQHRSHHLQQQLSEQQMQHNYMQQQMQQQQLATGQFFSAQLTAIQHGRSVSAAQPLMFPMAEQHRSLHLQQRLSEQQVQHNYMASQLDPPADILAAFNQQAAQAMAFQQQFQQQQQNGNYLLGPSLQPVGNSAQMPMVAAFAYAQQQQQQHLTSNTNGAGQQQPLTDSTNTGSSRNKGQVCGEWFGEKE
jgi:hypothetical protein